jgi:asparagine synthase (glutamine-hydrolysing)
MCGIAGVLNLWGTLGPSAEAEVEHLLAHMAYRGPDHRGILRVGSNVVIGTNRLAITDPANPAAHMPMSSPDGRFHVAWNGEIYNFRELRRQLTWRFRTASDTEVLLAAYARWGAACFEQLRGMFAVAIVDRGEDRVVLGVDPSGQKPLVWHLDGNKLIFASEIGALVADPFRSFEIDPVAIASVAAMCYLVGPRTHIRHIRRVEPGTRLVVDGDRVTVRRWWRVPLGDQSDDEVLRVAGRIRGAVQDACTATATGLEVPAGVLLSGGVDSTTVLAGIRSEAGAVGCHSVGFAAIDGEAFQPTVFDEFEHAALAADRFGCAHRTVRIDADDYFRCLERWLDLIDEPLASREGPSLCAVVEAASETCRVLFCGSGVDEVFDGYGHGARVRAAGAVHPDDVVRAYVDGALWLFGVALDRLVPDTDVLPHLHAACSELVEPYAGEEVDPLQLVQLLDLHGRCVTYEHRQVDAVTMAYSVEARAPLAERGVIEAAFAFHPALKQLGGRPKGIFIEAVRPLVPARLADRVKAGFPVPSQLWSTPQFAAAIDRTLEPGGTLDGLGIFDLAYLRQLAASPIPSDRNVFFRLVVIDGVLSRQGSAMTKPHWPARSKEVGVA